MTEAVIVSTARTGLGKSWKGAFNMTYGATLGAHSVQHAVARAGIDPAEVEDVIMGSTFGEGTTGGNIARQIALRAGLPITTAGMSINRFCSSGLQSIALAAQRVMTEGASVIVAGGLESISCVQNETNTHMRRDPWIDEHKPTLFWSMLQTAETVAKRYNISKEAQDEYGVRSQLRAAAGQAAGKFKDEIVPMTTTMGVVDKNTGAISSREVTISSDEGIRPDTTLEGVAKIRSAMPGGVITAGNASQFSDGSSACVVMDAKLAQQRGIKPLGIFRRPMGGGQRDRRDQPDDGDHGDRQQGRRGPAACVATTARSAASACRPAGLPPLRATAQVRWCHPVQPPHRGRGGAERWRLARVRRGPAGTPDPCVGTVRIGVPASGPAHGARAGREASDDSSGASAA